MKDELQKILDEEVLNGVTGSWEKFRKRRQELAEKAINNKESICEDLELLTYLEEHGLSNLPFDAYPEIFVNLSFLPSCHDELKLKFKTKLEKIYLQNTGSFRGQFILLISIALGKEISKDIPKDEIIEKRLFDNFVSFKMDSKNNLGIAYWAIAIMHQYAIGTTRDYQQAFEYFKRALSQGLLFARSSLGEMYEKGLGTSFMNYREAASQYLLLAQHGISLALFRRYLLYSHKGHDSGIAHQTAIEALTKAALLGNPHAQHHLYHRRFWFPQDIDVETQWLQRAAQQGIPEAQHCLGIHYLNGAGVPQSNEQAIFWLQKAALQNNDEAKYKLAKLLFNNKNYTEAFRWWKSAADRHTKSLYQLGRCYAEGQGAEKNDGEALSYFLNAAMKSNVKAQYETAKYYHYKSLNEAEAISWYAKADEKGHKEAACAIGNIYYIQPNYPEAFSWYKRGAEKGNARAQFQLGFMYSKGLGTIHDMKKAKEWWKKAAQQGQKEAAEALEKLNQEQTAPRPTGP